MLIKFVEIKNFRRLKSCRIDFSNKETVFVGANNSGKTTAMDCLILFMKEKTKITTKDFTLSNWQNINKIGRSWLSLSQDEQPNLSIDNWEDLLPQLDIWLNVGANEIHYINDLIPTLDWKGNELGVRLRFEPKNIESLYKDFKDSYTTTKEVINLASDAPNGNSAKNGLNLWPKTLWDFLEQKLHTHFAVLAYVLDAKRIKDPENGMAFPQKIDSTNLPLSGDPLNGLIKIDIINAQRGFSDPNTTVEERNRIQGNLSSQLRDYYTKHLNPYDQPSTADIDALHALENAKSLFDQKLSQSFLPSIGELEGLNYPGFGGNPSIKISSHLNVIDGLNHRSAVQFELFKSDEENPDFPLSLPEKYNGLGYQNLISMVFKLIRFRDEWMQVGKIIRKTIINEDAEAEFQPLHLVLVEEPEAHLHAQVQQAFIKKAYDVLRKNDLISKYPHFQTQLIVSTHSNHIAHEIDFTSLRYFKRCKPATGAVPTSTVVNLSETFGTETDSAKFAKRYLRTTHCDLFFADAVILVEGPVERMLIPHFIKHAYKDLLTCYIALLEIGGSHSHKLQPLLQDLGITTLIVTDIDSINPNDKNKAVIPEKNLGYKSGNTTLNSWIPGEALIDSLLDPDCKKETPDYPFRVAYQSGIPVKLDGDPIPVEIFPYTFEIALAFKNISLLKSLEGNGLLKKISDALKSPTAIEANTAMFEALKNARKAEFALELLFSEDPQKLKVPTYIESGLQWLQNILIPNSSK